jgi:TolA-binding protein
VALLVATAATPAALAAAEPAAAAAATAAAPALPGEGLGDVRDAARRFEDAVRQYQGEVRELVLGRLARRRAFAETSYAAQEKRIQGEQDRRRDEAIAAHERFVRRYPSHPEYTPDVMFRLGELYFERSAVLYTQAEAEYETLLGLYRAGKAPVEPELPEQDFSATVETYQLLLERFPRYRFADATLYLLGYCQENSGRERAALRTYARLALEHPASEFLGEAWLRTGEIHFDFGRFHEAAEAYAKVVEAGDPKLFELALYKLSWARYEDFDYDGAIRGFKQLIAWYDRNLARTRDERSAQLLAEAIDYLSRSLTEDDWDGDGLPDPGHGVERALSYLRDGEKYEERILEAYAESLFELHLRPKYEEAVTVYRTLVERNPTNPKNPEYQARIIEVWDNLREQQRAADARAELARRYSPGTPWYQANVTRSAAQAKADELVERSLRQKALWHQAHAQELKQRARLERSEALLVDAEREYAAAAASYAEYVARYPTGPHSYEMNFFWAEALYYSHQYESAAEKYEVVRDTPHKTDYLEYAAFSAIHAHEKAIDRFVQRGELPKDALRGDGGDPPAEEQASGEAGTGVKRLTPRVVPPPVLRWVQAVDAYVQRDLRRPKDPQAQGQLAYRAAEVFYRHQHMEEARKRFEAILDRYPDDLVASYAAANIVNSYRLENDWENIERWAGIIAERRIGKPEEQKALLEQIRYRKLGAQFRRAEELLAAGDKLGAAGEFERLVDQNPDFEDADDALYNAALAYQDEKHYDSAARLMERVVTEERFRTSELRQEALFRLSENARKFFDFDRAIAGYRALAETYPDHAQAYYALFQAAELAEFSGRLDDAVRDYRRYVERFHGQRDDVATVWFRMAEALRKKGDVRAWHTALQEFIDRYGGQVGTGEMVLEAYSVLAEAARAQGNRKRATALYRTILAEFQKRSLQPETRAATFAAQARFQLVEYEYEAFHALKLSGGLTQMGRTIQRKQELVAQLEQQYVEVFPYKAFDWTVAAYYRIGRIYLDFAKMLYDAPEPDLPEEDLELYRTQLEDEGVRWENVAIERYEETVRQARRLRIVNDWTKRTLEELSRYKPAEYRLFKEEKQLYEFEPLYSASAGPAPAVVPSRVLAPAPELDEPPAPAPAGAPEPATQGAPGAAPTAEVQP